MPLLALFARTAEGSALVAAFLIDSKIPYLRSN
jgi:hypothetical protein